MKLRWQNKRCSPEGLELMQNAVIQVEEKVVEANQKRERGGDSPRLHTPTLINDALYKNCICVSVAPNSNEGCCFRGMEVTQFEIEGKVYNIAIVRKPTPAKME